MTLKYTKNRLCETLNGFLSGVKYAGDFEEIFDILENIIDQASMYINDINDALNEMEEK